MPFLTIVNTLFKHHSYVTQIECPVNVIYAVLSLTSSQQDPLFFRIFIVLFQNNSSQLATLLIH